MVGASGKREKERKEKNKDVLCGGLSFSEKKKEIGRRTKETTRDKNSVVLC